ncbi:hypothetical protein CYMTET_35800 [Cymbomonas tetramitiformis]|uniref:WDR36/Utp21 C-terminal domain-containing protein n=1 Tax=Cymbomonas tetramitiformis TaxID=36881 RepID=A0AAE0F8L7_9CHLO|nr:hypothetical protein CYMTET_35800 [Cymbomonas tetramitiformis]
MQDQQSKELSQGKGFARKAKRLKLREEDLKLSRVMSLAHSETRERDWCNVITCHDGDYRAYVWHLARAALGKHILEPPHPPDSAAPAITSVAMSSCGNFGLVGTAAGSVHRFNMQSGLHRGGFSRTSAAATPTPAPRNRLPGQIGWKEEELLGTAHDGAVTGIACNSCNRFLVTVGFDGAMRIWDFKTRAETGSLQVGAPVTHLTMHTGSCLAATSSDDLCIQVYDVVALRRVRRYTGHTDRITDLKMSADARWLMSSSMDGTVRVWDIPSARLIQAMNLGPAVTSLSLSPNQDLLATTHVGRLGIYLWANRPLYLGESAASLLQGGSKAVDVRMPTVSDAVARTASSAVTTPADPSAGGEVDEEDEEEEEEESKDGVQEEGQEQELEALPSDERGMVPLAPQLLTLSLLPQSQWKSLMSLQTIKARNKPKAPPKKPELAPFFLPTKQNVEGTIDFDPQAGTDATQSGVDHFTGGSESKESAFLKLLQEGVGGANYPLYENHLFPIVDH